MSKPTTVDVRVYALMHRAMRRDSERLVDAVAGASRDDATLAGLQRWYDSYLAVIHHHHHHHHTGEDEGLFPDLVRRSAKLEDGLGELEDQHVELDALLTAMKTGLAALRTTAAEPVRAELTDTAGALRDHLAHHLDVEEALIFPEIPTLYSPAEWVDADKMFFKKGLTLRDMAFIAPWALSSAPDGDRAEILAAAPLLMRLLYRLSWRARYDEVAAPLTMAAADGPAPRVAILDRVG